MQLILNDLMGEYMIASDNFAADNLLTAATSSGQWDGTVTDLLAKVYAAANDISSGRNWLPTTILYQLTSGRSLDSSSAQTEDQYSR
jgi:hypothetical protein